MKACPKCGETYADDSLNFCLNDGTALNASSRPDQQTAVFPADPGRQTERTNYAPTQMAGGYSTAEPHPIKKKSKAWVWVLLILGAVVLLCGGGVAGLFYVGSQMPANIAMSTPTPGGTPSSSPSSTKSVTKASGEYDLSMEKYNQIKDGTTRAEAERIFGGPGKELSSTSAMGTTYATIQWEGGGYSSVILSFKDDKVFSRVQVGLK